MAFMSLRAVRSNHPERWDINTCSSFGCLFLIELSFAGRTAYCPSILLQPSKGMNSGLE